MAGFFESFGEIFGSSPHKNGSRPAHSAAKLTRHNKSEDLLLTPQDALLTHILLIHCIKDAVLRVIALATRNTLSARQKRDRSSSVSSATSGGNMDVDVMLDESMTPVRHLVDILSICLWHGLKNNPGNGALLPCEERHFWKVLEYLSVNPELSYQNRKAYGASVMLVKMNAKCSTPHGLCKAWLRQIINQDALKMNLEAFLSSETILKENYEDWAFIHCLCDANRYHGHEMDLKNAFLSIIENLQGIGFSLTVSDRLDSRAPEVPGAILTPDIVVYHILIETCLANMMPDEALARNYRASTVLVSGCGHEVDAEGRYLCTEIDEAGRPVFFNKTTGFKLVCSPYWSIYSNDKVKLYTTRAMDREPPRMGWTQVFKDGGNDCPFDSETSTSKIMIVLNRLRYAPGLNVALHVNHTAPVDKRRLATDELAGLVIEQKRVEEKRRKLYDFRTTAEEGLGLTISAGTALLNDTGTVEDSVYHINEQNNINAINASEHEHYGDIENEYPPFAQIQNNVVTNFGSGSGGVTLTSFILPESPKCDVVAKPIKVKSFKPKSKPKIKTKKKMSRFCRVKSREACIIEPDIRTHCNANDSTADELRSLLADISKIGTDIITMDLDSASRKSNRRNPGHHNSSNEVFPVCIEKDINSEKIENCDILSEEKTSTIEPIIRTEVVCPSNLECIQTQKSIGAEFSEDASLGVWEEGCRSIGMSDNTGSTPFEPSVVTNSSEETIEAFYHEHKDICTNDILTSSEAGTSVLESQKAVVSGDYPIMNENETDILQRTALPERYEKHQVDAVAISHSKGSNAGTETHISKFEYKDASSGPSFNVSIRNHNCNVISDLEPSQPAGDINYGNDASSSSGITILLEDKMDSDLFTVEVSKTPSNAYEPLGYVSDSSEEFFDAHDNAPPNDAMQNNNRSDSWDMLESIVDDDEKKGENATLTGSKKVEVDVNNNGGSYEDFSKHHQTIERSPSKSMILYMIRTYASLTDVNTEEAKDLAASIRVLTNGYVVGPFTSETNTTKSDSPPISETLDVEGETQCRELCVADVEITGHKIFKKRGNSHVRYIIRSIIVKGKIIEPDTTTTGDNCWLIADNNSGNDASIILDGKRRMSSNYLGEPNAETFIVHRRFNEFKELHDTLTKKYPKASLPPLPRTSFRRRFGNGYIEKKGGTLQEYLSKLLKVETSPSWNDSMPLASDKIVTDFLTTIPDDYSSLWEGGGDPNLDGENIAASLHPRPAISEGLHVSLILDPMPDSKSVESKGTSDTTQCEACGIALSSSHWKSDPTFCHYLQRWFCRSCFTGTDSKISVYTIPSILLHEWKIVKLPVCHLVVEYLDSVREHPLVCASSINPELYSKDNALAIARRLRLKLVLGKEHIACQRKFAEIVPILDHHSLYLSQDTEMYSLAGLEAGCGGTLLNLLFMAVEQMMSHINQCARCSGNGYVCELCDDDHPIYPFQVDTVVECHGCKGYYHRECFMMKEDRCPQCLRRRNRTRDRIH